MTTRSRNLIRGLRAWFVVLWLAGLAPTVSAAVAPGGQGARPNILFVLMDDMGWTDAGVLGSDFYETPNIDRLRHAGMSFTDAYASAPNCSPSRACIMTGLYPPRHGIYTVGSSERGRAEERKLIPIPNTHPLDPAFETVAESLRRAGYRTFLGGKWNLGEGDAGPEAQGFDVNVGGNDSGKPDTYFAPWRNPQLGEAPAGTHLCDYVTDRAIDFIGARSTEPFFAYVAYYDVHTPMEAKPDLVRKYEAKIAANAVAGIRPEHGDPVYAAMLENADANVGRLLEALEQRGLADDTLVVFFSDNGGYGEVTSMRPLRGSKGMLYEGGIRVPLLVRWPGKIEPGSSCAVPVNGIDFFPTFLALAGAPAPAGRPLDGLSLLPLFSGGKGSWPRDVLFWHCPVYLEKRPQRRGDDSHDGRWRGTPSSAIRAGNWKLIEYYEDGALELFDLGADPGERHNLATVDTVKTAELQARLKAWRDETGAPVPVNKNPRYKPAQP